MENNAISPEELTSYREEVKQELKQQLEEQKPEQIKKFSDFLVRSLNESLKKGTRKIIFIAKDLGLQPSGIPKEEKFDSAFLLSTQEKMDIMNSVLESFKQKGWNITVKDSILNWFERTVLRKEDYSRITFS